MAYTAKNEDFIAAEQYVHQAIANKSKETKSIWKDMIETGPFEYGRGYMMKKHAFYGGKEIMDSTGDWAQLKAPEDRGEEEDACSYNPPIVGYGFEEKMYTIYETTRRTETICLRDLVYKWQFENQLRMIFNSLSDITLGVWEKFLRETYVNFCTKLIVAEGFPQFSVDNSVNANGVMDNAGLRQLDISSVSSASQIGLLTQKALDYQYQYLARQARSGKSGSSKGDMPVFTLVTSFETSTEIVENDVTYRTDRRYIPGKEDYLLDGYGTIEGFKNFAHIHDLETPRYKLAANGTKLERVYPFEFSPTNIGDQCHVNREYVRAEFELSIIFLKEVFKGLIPENPQSVAGASFGGCSNLGEFKWLNIQSETTNLLKENGFMFARFNASPEPLDQVDNALCLLHRRPSYVPITLPDDQTEDGVTTALTISTVRNVIVASPQNIGGQQETLPTTTDEIEVVLSGNMDITVGGTAEVAGTNAPAEKTVMITKDFGAGNRYRLRFDDGEALADWATIIAAAGDWTVNGN